MDFTKAVQEIADTIKMMFDLQKDRLIYDKSFIVKVTEALGNNKYRVSLNGQSYDCPSLNNAQYVVNDKAIMLVPCQIWEKVILMGKVGA